MLALLAFLAFFLGVAQGAPAGVLDPAQHSNILGPVILGIVLGTFILGATGTAAWRHRRVMRARVVLYLRNCPSFGSGRGGGEGNGDVGVGHNVKRRTGPPRSTSLVAIPPSPRRMFYGQGSNVELTVLSPSASSSRISLQGFLAASEADATLMSGALDNSSRVITRDFSLPQSFRAGAVTPTWGGPLHHGVGFARASSSASATVAAASARRHGPPGSPAPSCPLPNIPPRAIVRYNSLNTRVERTIGSFGGQ